MKYAIVENGGKQYKAQEESTIVVDRMLVEIGDEVSLDTVLLMVDGEDINIGAPVVDGAKVNATVVAQEKGPKIVVFKYRPRKRYRVKTGHRQRYTRLLINSIVLEK